jgi:integrase/recombinase XerD
MNLRSALTEFLLDRQSFGRKPATIRFYRGHLSAMAEFMEGTGVEIVEQVSPSTLRAWFAHLHERDISHNTIAAYDRAARAFFAFCRQEGWVDEDPMGNRRRIRQEKRRPDTLDLDEVKALIQTCNEDTFGIRDRAIMLLLLDTGLRAGELVGLTMDDIELDNHHGRVYVRAETSKSRHDRMVPFQRQTAKALQMWFSVRPGTDGPIFLAADGVNMGKDPLTAGGLNQLMHRHAQEAGLEEEHGRWCHIWRHTFAKRYVLAGGDLETLRRFLGHSSLDTVQIYLSFRTQDLEEKHAKLSPVLQIYSDN